DAGAAVLVEKPLCRTLAEADLIVAAAHAHQQHVLYAENLAYAPVINELVGRVAALGQLEHLEVRTIQALPTWGDFTSDEWGGGALFDLGVHPLAIALLVAAAAGEGRPVAVTAQLRGGEGHNSDEHADVTLQFASGLHAHVVSSWQGGPTTVWDVQVASATGVLRADLMPTPTLELNGEAIALPPITAPVAAVEQFGYVAQLKALVDDSADGRTPTMSAAFGRDVLQVVCAAYSAAGSGTAVALPFAGPRHLTPLELWHSGGGAG
ncbi:MAG: hypothetical protein ABIQ39_15070, partial [Ilumatobacteraceae bacterium]